MITEESGDTEVKCPWRMFVTNTLMSLFGENPKPTCSAPEHEGHLPREGKESGEGSGEKNVVRGG